MASGDEKWSDSKLLARAILHDRKARRKILARMLVFVLVLLALGLWVIDDWLAGSLLWFLLWWSGCALMTGVLMLFTLYDALAAVREERKKHR